jgi:pSer/pThr/pTyr-binding forkhead associated (FHA) protein
LERLVSNPSGFALRFISGKYQGGEFALPDDADIVMGRGGELDIVLVEDMVSRRHAKITTSKGKVLIEDIGSTNGTFVNGEKVTKARLKEGDRILIGTNILKLIPVTDAQRASAGATREEFNAELDAIGRRQASAADVTSGTLTDLPLAEVLTLLSTQKKSAVVEITDNTGDSSGRVHLRDGKIYYASVQDDTIPPLKALFRMVHLSDGSFVLQPAGDETFLLNLDDPTEQLIADAVRQSQELKVLAPSLPEPEDMLAISKPLDAPLSALQAQELDVLQTVFNRGFVQSILDRSPFPDLHTYQILKGLLDRGYIHD